MHAALARMQPLAQRVALNYVVRYQVGRRGELIMLLENVWLFLTTNWKEEKRGCWEGANFTVVQLQRGLQIMQKFEKEHSLILQQGRK